MAEPIYATRRNPAAYSEGEQVAVIAATLGTPLIPWQRQVADVAEERRADGSYEYQIVVVSVPRQTGKTTLLRAIGTKRALVNGRDVFYTAQKGKDARERWLDLVKILRTHPAFRDRVEVALRGGSEQVLFPSGGAFRVFAPSVESLHGYTPPTVMLDEAFALPGGHGELLMGAIGPAQITILDRQIWIVSTAGTAESTFLHDWIDRGMEGAPRVACFYWGARDDQDPFNPDHIAAFHPGIGHTLNGKILTTTDVLEQAETNTRAEYERAYANRRTLTVSHLIPAETWRALVPEGGLTPPADLTRSVLTYDVSHDRRAGSIVAAWYDDDQRLCVRLVKAAPGTGWMPGELRQLKQRWRPRAIAAVGSGPVMDVTQQLTHAPAVDVRVLSEREYATACGAFLSAIEEQTIHHDDEELLNRSAVGLVTRPAVSDGVAFSRRHSVGDSSAAIAAAVASWVAAHHVPEPAPMLYLGKG